MGRPRCLRSRGGRVTPTCQCGGFVSRDYARVFAPEDREGEADVRACPSCTWIRDRGGVRRAKARGSPDVEGDVA